jgi:hypothetical protein
MGQYNFNFESAAQAQAFMEFFKRLMKKPQKEEEDAAALIAPDSQTKVLTNELWVKRMAQGFQYGWQANDDQQGQAEAVEGQGVV